MTESVAGSSRLSVMNFLNEAANDYPHAISFASGRPVETFFSLERRLAAVPAFEEHAAKAAGQSLQLAGRRLAQYGHTAGMINALIAGQLRSGRRSSGTFVSFRKTVRRCVKH